MLRVTPLLAGDTFGYIYLEASERTHLDALVAYFNSSNRAVHIFPCADFDQFLRSNHLRPRDISFLSDLPHLGFILASGRRTLRDNDYSGNAGPNLSWLPTLPSNPSLGSNPTVINPPDWRPLHPNVSTRSQPPPPSSAGLGRRPVDPDGVDSSSLAHPVPPAPFTWVGGLPSISSMSPLTTSLGASLYSDPRYPSPYAGHPSARGFIPSGNLSVVSSVEGSLQPASSDSSATTPAPIVTAPPATPTVTTPAPIVTAPPATPTVTIKDKPSDLGIKPIKDKESWITARKVIDARLRRAPYWSGPEGTFITTPDNAAASGWWEEVLAFYCEPPVSDLFVGETRFDGKGFERIDYIERHFHPSGAVDSLGYIFDLIDIKQSESEQVVSLKARFSTAFSSLKMGGITIDSALQVGFMLRALLSRYHAVVQEFRLGRHPLTTATLQTVVDQCVNYDKDPFLGPVGKDGKLARQSPSANAAGAGPGDGDNPYEALAAKSFNYHVGRWKNALVANKGTCMFCHGTSRTPAHKSRDCPILKKLGLQFTKRSDAAPQKAASRVTAASAPTPSPEPASVSPPPADTAGGTTVIPGGFLAAAELDAYDSGDDYNYEGKLDGAMFNGDQVKPKVYSRDYLDSLACCCRASTDSPSPVASPHYPLLGET